MKKLFIICLIAAIASQAYALTNQTITIVSKPTSVRFGGADFTIVASASSNLQVTFTSNYTSGGSSGLVQIVGTPTFNSSNGQTTATIHIGSRLASWDSTSTYPLVTISQAGNATYSVATDVIVYIAVKRGYNKINFTLPSSITYNAENTNNRNLTLSPNPSATCGLPLTISSSRGPEWINYSSSGSTMIYQEAATVTFIASVSGWGSDYNYIEPPATVSQTIVINPAPQSISFTPTSWAKTFGDPAFTPSAVFAYYTYPTNPTNPTLASNSNGNPITLASDNTSVATISGHTIIITGAGTANITATQAGSSLYSYAAATPVTRTLTVNRASQTITFDTLPTRTYGDTSIFYLHAYSSSGYPLNLSSSNQNVAIITYETNDTIITINGAGSTNISASQNGYDQDNNHNYNAATNVVRALTVNRANQTIIWADTLNSCTYGDILNQLTATSTSGLPVNYLSSNTSVATVINGNINIVGVGSTIITVKQAGNSNYNAAKDTSQTLVVNRKEQYFNSVDIIKTYGNAPFTFNASVSTGLPFTYAASNPSIVSLNGNLATISSAGSTYIRMSQPGNTNYNAVLDSFTLTVNPASQTITFGTLTTKTFGDAPFGLTATSSSGLKVTFSSNSLLNISNDTASILGVGTGSITASQEGNTNYRSAFNVTRTFTINKANQTITFNTLPASTYGDASFQLTAAASSGLPIKYTSSNSLVASVTTDGFVTINGAGTTNITASQNGADLYNIKNYNAASNVVRTLTVNKATLTITADNQSKTYGDNNPALTFSYSGFVNNEDPSYITAPTISTSATAISDSGKYDITLSGGSATNYTLVLVKGTLTINKAVLTATANNKTKIYGDSNPALTIEYSGFLNGDNTSSIISPTASTVVSNSDAGTYDITLTGGSAKNYSFNLVSGNLTINKATLTVTASDKSKTYGAAVPALNIAYSGFVNGDNLSSINQPPTVSTIATQTSNAGNYDIALSGGNSTNYSFSLVNGTLTVNRATLTATALGKSMVYGDPVPTLTISYTGFVNGDDINALTQAPVASTLANSKSDAGNYDITLTGGSAINYSINLVTGSLAITKAPLTITANDRTIYYTDAIPAFIYLYSGFVNGDNSSVLLSIPTATTTATSISSIGTYPINLSGGSAKNYAFNLVNGTLTIDKTLLTITADDKSITYGEAIPQLTFSYRGFINGDNAANSLSQLPTISTSATQTSGAGNYDILLSGAVANNYTVSMIKGTLTVNKASLTITASDKSKSYGEAVPLLNMTYNGFVNGENTSAINKLPLISTLATQTSDAGTYDITLSDGNALNYALTLVDGTLTVNKAALTATAIGKTMVYGGAVPPLVISYSGFVNGDNVGSITQAPTIATSANNFSSVGNYNITLSGGSTKNYSFNLVNGNLAITKAPLTITVNDKLIYFSDSIPEFTYSYNGFVNGDVANVFTSLPTATTTAIKTSNPGTYPINLSGGSANNYALNLVNGTLTIDKTLLTITADDKSIIYGEEIPQLTFSYKGFINGDDVSTLKQIPTVTTSATKASGAGTYDITLSSAVANNYSIALIKGTLTINKAPLTITAADKSTIYGGTIPTLDMTFNGFVNGDTTSAISQLPILNTSATQKSNTGKYDITLAGGSAKNYLFNLVSGNLSIIKDNLLVTANPKSRLFGKPNPKFDCTIAGFVNGDSISSLTGHPTYNCNVDSSTDAGTYTISVSVDSMKSANYTFNTVNSTLTILQAPQTIMLPAISAKSYGNLDFQLQGTASSALPVKYSSSDTTVAKLTFNRVTNVTYCSIVGAGTTDIVAKQPGSNNYLAAPDVTTSLMVKKTDQSISFDTLSVKKIGDASFKLSATASSNLPVDYSSSNPYVAIVSGNTVMIVGIGATTIAATQAGNQNYNAAKIVSHDFTIQYPSPEICLVTVANNGVSDTIGHNVIVWEKQTIVNFKAYNVYRESSVAGQYDKIGTVPNTSLGIFIDTLVNPRKQAYFYKLTATDENNIETDVNLSNYSKTIHLVTTKEFGKPGVQLQWDEYIGFPYSTYYIYRSSNGTDFAVVDSMASSSTAWTDVTVNPASGANDPVYYYYVGVHKANPCNLLGTKKAGGGNYADAVSNMEDNRLRSTSGTLVKGIETSMSIVVYPQPVKDNLNVMYLLEIPGNVELEIFDLMGGKVAQIKLGNTSAKVSTYRLDIASLNLQNGMYYLKLKTKYESGAKKFLITK